MNSPKFIAGSYTVQPEHPNGWSVNPIGGYVKNITLGGTQVKDVMYRKYEYILSWDSMHKDDFELLQQLVNYHNDEGENILFSYNKFESTTSPIECHCDLLERSFASGSGSSDYYQSVTMTLTEVSSRI